MKKIISALLLISLMSAYGCASDVSYPPESGTPVTTPVLPSQDDTCEWEMCGTWYSVYGGWYSGCVMVVGDLVDGKFHVEFYKDGELRFDEDVEYDAHREYATFTVKDPGGNTWNDITMEFYKGECGAQGVGTRPGSRFEKEGVEE